jgi:tRNA1Val (adenine37-N6)-methyltransferase
VKPFKFKHFEIEQSPEVFRVGTDGVLLGAVSNVENAMNVLEVGTGTGLISLMLAQRNSEADFLGLDINQKAKTLAARNFQNSQFSERLNALLSDFKTFESDEKFDLIVSNPPYFEASDSTKDKLARQKIELSFNDLIKKSSLLLNKKGVFSVIIPAEAGEYFTRMSLENRLFLNAKVNIYGIKNGLLKRLILEFSPERKEYSETDFVIEKSPRKYSDQYLELTKEFHVFKG